MAENNDIERLHIRGLIARLQATLAQAPADEQADWRQEIEAARSYLAELERDDEDEAADLPHLVNVL